MIPLRSTIPPQQLPWVNYTLVGINATLFAYEVALGPQMDSFVLAYGWVPANISQALLQGHLPALAPLLLSMFLHGGWLHLGGNLLYLHIFGGNVEDRLGHVRYFCFYYCGGVVAMLIQTYAVPFSPTPMIGASGAIAAVIGAYCVFYPTARVLTLLPRPISLRVVRVPAVFYLLFWVALQILGGASPSLGINQPVAGGAWWAHVGGFVAGVILGPLFLLKKNRRSRYGLQQPLLWHHNPRSAVR
jgi:membrane associated rhomboid family serine protease